MAEIVAQHDNAPGYWVSLMAVNNAEHYNTVVVMNLAVRIGQIVAAFYKDYYDATATVICVSRPAAGLRSTGACVLSKRSFDPELALVAVPGGGGACLQG